MLGYAFSPASTVSTPCSCPCPCLAYLPALVPAPAPVWLYFLSLPLSLPGFASYLFPGCIIHNSNYHNRNYFYLSISLSICLIAPLYPLPTFFFYCVSAFFSRHAARCDNLALWQSSCIPSVSPHKREDQRGV